MGRRVVLTTNLALEGTIDKILKNTENDVLSSLKSALDDSQQSLDDSITKLESEYDKIMPLAKRSIDKLVEESKKDVILLESMLDNKVVYEINNDLNEYKKTKNYHKLTTKEKEISQETLSDQALSLLEEAKIKKEAQKAGLTREAKMAKIAALKKVLVDVEFDNPEHAELVALFFKYVDEMESKHNRNKELGRRLEELEERLKRFSKKESSDHKDRHPGQDKKREDK